MPEVTLGFWIIKILATTLGETGGDAVSMSMDLGYAIGSFIFAAIFAVAVGAQIAAKKFHPFLYWFVIIATTTLGTTMADFATRSMGIGYTGGSSMLFALLLVSFFVWHRSAGSISVDSIATPKVEMFYWITFLFWSAFILTRPLGATLGDLLDKPVDHGGFAFDRFTASAILAGVILVLIALVPQRAGKHPGETG